MRRAIMATLKTKTINWALAKMIADRLGRKIRIVGNKVHISNAKGEF